MHMDDIRQSNVVSGAAFLTALQLADGALPIGRYVHSGGLEKLLSRVERTPEKIRECIVLTILHGAGRCDAVAAAHAHRAFSARDIEGVHAVDRRLLATKLSLPARNASLSCGRQLAKVTLQVWPHHTLNLFCAGVLSREEAGNLSVVSAAVCASRGLSLEHTLLIELRGTASNLLSAAVRLGHLKSIDGQLQLRQCEPAILRAAERAMAASLEDMSSTTIELEIAMLQHQDAPLKLFAT